MSTSYTRASNKRYRQIAEILARHGMGYLVGVLGLDRFAPEHLGLSRVWRSTAPTPPEHVRLAIEELGITFIKLGQILSTRPDLVPPDLQVELAKLQDAAPTVPLEEIRDTVAAELGSPVEEIFAAFDPVPLAAASIGQVHAAVLRDGTEVVVKVRRPGAVEQVEADLAILQRLALAASRHWEAAQQYDVVLLVEEFAQTLRAELDYVREARNAEHFAANFANDPSIHIPRIYWDMTTARVLTLQRLYGIKISDVTVLDAAGIDRRELAERAIRVLLKMIFEDGLFHADPHPGNFFVEPDSSIGLIDFGMVGVVDERSQEHLAAVLFAVTGRDAGRLTDAFIDLGVARGHVERAELQGDLGRLLARYHDRQLGEIEVGPLLREVLEIVRHHHLQLPSNLALLLKTVIMSEGVGVQVDPQFRLTTILAPYAQQFMLRQYSPARWLRQLTQASMDAAQLGVELPSQVHHILRSVENGNLEVGIHLVGIEPVIHRVEKLVNRLALVIITASFVMGLALLMSRQEQRLGEPWSSLFFVVGFVIAGALGFYLVWRILRSGGS